MKNYEYIEIPLLSVTKTPMVLLSTCEQGRKSFLQFNDFQKIILKGCDSVLYSLSLSQLSCKQEGMDCYSNLVCYEDICQNVKTTINAPHPLLLILLVVVVLFLLISDTVI